MKKKAIAGKILFKEEFFPCNGFFVLAALKRKSYNDIIANIEK